MISFTDPNLMSPALVLNRLNEEGPWVLDDDTSCPIETMRAPSISTEMLQIKSWDVREWDDDGEVEGECEDSGGLPATLLRSTLSLGKAEISVSKRMLNSTVSLHLSGSMW